MLITTAYRKKWPQRYSVFRQIHTVLHPEYVDLVHVCSANGVSVSSKYCASLWWAGCVWRCVPEECISVFIFDLQAHIGLHLHIDTFNQREIYSFCSMWLFHAHEFHYFSNVQSSRCILEVQELGG